MDEPEVLYTTEAGVATITLNRPDTLNALTKTLMAQLGVALDRAGLDDAVRAVIVTGAGRGFCSGADLKNAMPRDTSVDLGTGLRDGYHGVILSMRNLPKPIVTAVNGPAAGAGMSIAIAGDIVLAARSASFLQAFARIGLIPDAGSTWFLPRLAGDVRARAMAMLAEPMSADDALRCGLVWKVFDDDTLPDEARAIARRMATMPTRAYALVKQAFAQSGSNSLAQQLEVEADLQTLAGRTEDFREGVAAFVERRAPKFKGR